MLISIDQANAHRYPVWASLARDYLSVMASSVSSERAFSSAGITISKRRNRLKADIVEALQGLKCMIRRDILFREHPTIRSELAAGDGHAPPDTAKTGRDSGAEGDSWDTILEGDDVLDELGSDCDDDDVFVQSIS